MKTKRNQKNEQDRNLERFYETKWLKHAVTTYNRAWKKVWINEIHWEFQGVRLSYIVTEMKAKMRQKKKSFLFFQSFFSKFFFQSLFESTSNWDFYLVRSSHMVKKMKAKRTQLKKFFSKKINLKLIKTNSYKIKSLTKLSYTS